MAVSIGLGPVVGQNYGAGRNDRVRQALHMAIIFCVVWSVFTGLALMFVGPWLAAQFSADPGTIAITAAYFWLMGISKAVPNVVVGWGTLWYAVGKPKYGIVNNLGILGVGTILAGYIGMAVGGGGWYGLFMGMMVGQLLTGLALHFWSVSHLSRLERTAK
jgi:Na+-driven multidrug efflux pump